MKIFFLFKTFFPRSQLKMRYKTGRVKINLFCNNNELNNFLSKIDLHKLKYR